MKTISVYLSFLDLMCCGLGSTLLLFLLVAASVPNVPVTGYLPNPTLLVRFSAEESAQGRIDKARPEIQVRWKPPSHLRWHYADDLRSPNLDKLFVFHDRATPGGGAESIFVHTNPEPGAWEFQAWIVTKNGNTIKPVSINCLPVGEGVTLETDPKSSTQHIEREGQFSPIFRVLIANPADRSDR